jgi:membrane protease YdiL (CAAX protease family)
MSEFVNPTICIVAASNPAASLAPLWPSLLLAIGTAAMLGMRVFKRDSIVGPERLKSERPAEAMIITIGGGMSAWFSAMAGAKAVIHTPATPDLALVAAGMIANITAVGIMLGMLAIMRVPPGQLGIRGRQVIPGVLRGAAAMLVVIPLLYAASLATDGLWKLLHLDGQYVHEMLTMLGGASNKPLWEAILLSIVVVTPISEEFFFRGCIQTLLGHWLSQKYARPATARWVAVISTSLLFASLHQWWAAPPIFVLALCLGYAYERTGNLWTCITIHALFNAAEVAFYLVTAH